jgi:N-acetylmuramoyl-L-alanine amidase
MKIFIDPGHGGKNTGAVGVNGIKEEEVNLDVALRLGRILQQAGYTVNYSRTTDSTVSLSERAKLANEWGANYFVSIHCNSNTNPIYTGCETFFYREGTVSQRFAIAVNNALAEETGLKNIGAFQANFAVLRLTYMPAILVELALLSNPEDAQKLSESAFRQLCAQGIANGIFEFAPL